MNNIKSEKLNNFNSERKYTKQIAIAKQKLDTIKAISNPSSPNAKTQTVNSEQ